MSPPARRGAARGGGIQRGAPQPPPPLRGAQARRAGGRHFAASGSCARGPRSAPEGSRRGGRCKANELRSSRRYRCCCRRRPGWGYAELGLSSC